jgi:hypothetical protein
MAIANRIELFNAAPVDMSIDASSSSPLGEDPATSGVQRLVVALVPDGVGEPDAMARSVHVLTMFLHDEHVGCTVVGVFVPVAVHSVPTRVVPSPHVTVGATQVVLPAEDDFPVGHDSQLLVLPFTLENVEDGHALQAAAPTTSLNSPTPQTVHDICPVSLWKNPTGQSAQDVEAMALERYWPAWHFSHAPLVPVPASPAPQAVLLDADWQLALQTVPSSVVPDPHVAAGATQVVLPSEDDFPVAQLLQAVVLAEMLNVSTAQFLQATAPDKSPNLPGIHGKQ